MITVLKSRRIGFTAGCWKITRAQAKQLCGGTLPRCGYEREVRREEGIVWNELHTCSFPITRRAWVANRSNTTFVLTDEGRILDVAEKKDTNY